MAELAIPLPPGGPRRPHRRRRPLSRAGQLAEARRRAPRDPRQAELGYLRTTRRLAAEMARATTEALEGALRETLPDGERADAALPSRLSRALNGLRRQLEELATGVRSGARNAGEQVDRHSMRELARVLEVDALGQPSVAGHLEGWVDEQVRLVDSLGRRHHADVAKVVEEGFRAGHRHEEIAQELRARAGVTQRRAELIARDQVLSLHAKVTRERHKAAGITHYTWITSRDERVRRSHRAMDGRVIAYDAPPLVDGVHAHAGDPINCRCTQSPRLPGEDEVVPQPEPGPAPPPPSEPAPTPAPPPAPPPDPKPKPKRPPRPKKTPQQRRAEQVAKAHKAMARGFAKAFDDAEPAQLRAAVKSFAREVVGDIGQPKGSRVHELGVYPHEPGADLGRLWPSSGLVELRADQLDLIEGAAAKMRRGAAFTELEFAEQDAIATLVHEEHHGFSPMGPYAYQGASKVLEEVAVETSTRAALDPEGKIWGLTKGSYRRWIDLMVDRIQLRRGLDTRAEAWAALQDLSLKWITVPTSSLEGVDDVVRWWAREIGDDASDLRAHIEVLTGQK